MRWKLAVWMVCAALLWSTPALAQAPGSSETEGSLNSVEALTVKEKDDGTYIHIRGTEVATFSVFKLDDPPRLFVDLSNSKLADGELSQDVYNGVISQVGVVEFEDGFQETTRLVVGFEQPAHYDVRMEGKEVVVYVDGDARKAAPDAVAAHSQEELEEARQRLRKTEQRYEEQVSQRQQDYERAVGELETTHRQLEQAQKRLEQMERQRQEAAGEERQELEASIAAQSQELEKARHQLDERQQHVDKMQNSLAQLEAERDQERARYEAAREQAEEAEARAEQARQQAEQARQSERQAHQKVEELEQRLQEMDQDVDGAEQRIALQRQKFEEAQRRAAQLEEELAQARAQGQESTAEEVAAEQQRWQQLQQERQQELQSAQQQARELEEERQKWQRMHGEGQRELERAQRKSEELAQERELWQKRHQQRQEELEGVEREREELTQALAERDAEIEELKKKARQIHPDAPNARAIPFDPDDENTIRAVRLETDEFGRSQIVVDLDRPGNFQTRPMRENGRAVMILNDVELPTELERTLANDVEGGAVRFVSSYKEEDGTVRMEAELGGDSSEMIRQDGNQVIWEFAPQVAREQGGQRTAMDEQPAQKAQRPSEGESVTSAPPHYPRVVVNPTEVHTVPGIGSQPLTIDLRNADIANVLRLVSEHANVNIIAGDDVSGHVTMKLQRVPLDEAFLTILQSLQLGFEVRGNVIRVAPQSVLADEEAARAEARARAQELEPLEVFLLPVNYASASDLTAQVDGLLSQRGSVSVDDRTNTLIITDLADNLQAIRMLIETLDAQVPQVLIEARIVETNEAFEREIGIQWGGDFSRSQGAGNPTGLIFPNVFGLSGGATDGEAPVEGTSENPNYAVNLPAAAGTGQGGALGLTMGSVGGSVNLNMRLSAMEDAGYARIVSSPRILTLDNREATISQGTSIPISVVSAAGVQTIFVDATLELTVTPHVTPDGNVRMAIEATKNEPDFQNTGARGDPTIIQNQAETELLVADGDTTVIGGIYTENTGHSMSAVPFFHRLPILGFLFRSRSKTENRSELLIFITPRIVNRAEALGVMSSGVMGGQVPSVRGASEE